MSTKNCYQYLSDQYGPAEIVSIFCIISITIITIIVGIDGFIGFINNKEIRNIFKYLFIITLFLSLIIMISLLLIEIFCIEGIEHNYMLQNICTAAYILLFLSLLSILI